ncbi:hypothetical protein PQX77_002828 [Marasmius sp. AFHP31]|nr:hypothetical protein PQX77_002828 [Marasmius sp. AFHP31]
MQESSTPTNTRRISLSSHGRKRRGRPRHTRDGHLAIRTGPQRRLEVNESAESMTLQIVDNVNDRQPTQSTRKRRRGVNDSDVGPESKRLRLERDNTPPQEHTTIEDQPLPLAGAFVFDFDVPCPDLQLVFTSECEPIAQKIDSPLEDRFSSIFVPIPSSFSPLEVTSPAEVTLESGTMVSNGMNPPGAEQGDIGVGFENTEDEDLEDMGHGQSADIGEGESVGAEKQGSVGKEMDDREELGRNESYDEVSEVPQVHEQDTGLDEEGMEMYEQDVEDGGDGGEMGRGQRAVEGFYGKEFEANVIDGEEDILAVYEYGVEDGGNGEEMLRGPWFGDVSYSEDAEANVADDEEGLPVVYEYEVEDGGDGVGMGQGQQAGDVSYDEGYEGSIVDYQQDIPEIDGQDIGLDGGVEMYGQDSYEEDRGDGEEMSRRQRADDLSHDDDFEGQVMVPDDRSSPEIHEHNVGEGSPTPYNHKASEGEPIGIQEQSMEHKGGRERSREEDDDESDMSVEEVEEHLLCIIEEDEDESRGMSVEEQSFGNKYSWAVFEEEVTDLEEANQSGGWYEDEDEDEYEYEDEDAYGGMKVEEQSFSNYWGWQGFEEEFMGIEAEIGGNGYYEEYDENGDMIVEERPFTNEHDWEGLKGAAVGPEEEMAGDELHEHVVDNDRQQESVRNPVDGEDVRSEEVVKDEGRDMDVEEQSASFQPDENVEGRAAGSDASMEAGEQSATEPQVDGGQSSHAHSGAHCPESLGGQGNEHPKRRGLWEDTDDDSSQSDPQPGPQPSAQPRGKATGKQPESKTSRKEDRSPKTSTANPFDGLPKTPKAENSDPVVSEEDEESLRGLLARLIPLISDQKQQAKLLAAMVEKDCDLYALIGRASVNLRIAHEKTDPFSDRDGFQKVKRRAQTTLDLARLVRKEISTLTQPKGAPLMTITSEQRKEWQRTRYTCRGPTIANFVLDLTSDELWKDNKWNQQAAAIFTDWFVGLEGYESFKKLDVTNAFKTHLRSLKKQFTHKNSPTSNHKEVHTTDRRTMRKRNHCGRRVEAARTFAKLYPAMKRFVEPVKYLTLDMMSGEETEHDKKGKSPKKHRALFQQWRSDEFTEFLRLLDALHILTRFLEGTRKYSPGQFPCWRTPSTKPDCDYHPAGLPENWYSKEYLDEEPDRRKHLKVGAPVPLRLPDDVLRIAKRFLHVTCRKDLPLDANQVSLD